MNFTKNNYLRTFGSGSTFRAEIDPPQEKNSNYHSITKSIVEDLYSKKQGKVYLMYSGGVDSEYLLNIFLSFGMDVTPVIVKLNPKYNEHDVRYAFDFCRSKNLDPLIIDIDFDHFVKSGKILDVALDCKCGAYQLPSTFYAVGQLEGTVVMGSHGPSHIVKMPNGSWSIDEMECIHSVLRWFENKKIYGHPFVLAYTPEQYLSFLTHPLMKEVSENKYPGKLGSNFIKGQIYNDLSGFNLTLRHKFTGYEHIEKREIFQHENMRWFKNQGQQWYGIYYENYQDIVTRLQNG